MEQVAIGTQTEPESNFEGDLMIFEEVHPPTTMVTDSNLIPYVPEADEGTSKETALKQFKVLPLTTLRTGTDTSILDHNRHDLGKRMSRLVVDTKDIEIKYICKTNP